jgi:hypothetical protein
VAEADEAIWSTVSNNLGTESFGQPLAVANNGKTVRESLDRYFQLLTESPRNDTESCRV